MITPPYFLSALKILNYLECNRRKVGTVELSKHLEMTIRTVQRQLKFLSEAGLVECDNANPKGYRFVTYQIKEKT